MKKKFIFIIILFILLISNVSAKTIDKKEVDKTYKKLSNPRTGVINLKMTLIPIGIIGGCLIIYNKKDKTLKNRS